MLKWIKHDPSKRQQGNSERQAAKRQRLLRPLRRIRHESLEDRRVLAATIDVSVAAPGSVPESSNEGLVYTLTRDQTIDRLAVRFELSGDAVFGEDYSVDEADPDTVYLPEVNSGSGPVIGNAVFPAGESTISFSVDPIDDSLAEPNEDVIVTILEPQEFGPVFGAASQQLSGSPTRYYAVDEANQLAIVNVETGIPDVIGTIDSAQSIQDLAFLDDGTLFGISSDNLYEIELDDVNGGLVDTRFLGAHNIIAANALTAARGGDFNSEPGDLLAVGTAALDLQGIDLEFINGQWVYVQTVTLFDIDGALQSEGFVSNFESSGDLDYLSDDQLVLSATEFDLFSNPAPYDSLIEIATPGTTPVIESPPVPAQDPGVDFDEIFGLAFDGFDSFAFSGKRLLTVNPLTLNTSFELQMAGEVYNVGAPSSAVGTIVDSASGGDRDGIGLYQPDISLFHLRETLTPGLADIYARFGPDGDSGWGPLAGDWNNDGVDTIGLYQPSNSLFHLTDSFLSTTSDHLFAFGPGGPGWLPVAGDWNGDGVETVGLYEVGESLFHLKNSFTGGAADIYFSFGTVGTDYVPVAGDWNGDGLDTVGLYRTSDSTFLLSDDVSAGPPDQQFAFGPAGGAGWRPLAGDWDGDGIDTVGLYQPNLPLFHLKNTFSGGSADEFVAFGPFGDQGWIPIAGDWSAPAATAPLAVPLNASAAAVDDSDDDDEAGSEALRVDLAMAGNSFGSAADSDRAGSRAATMESLVSESGLSRAADESDSDSATATDAALEDWISASATGYAI